MAQFYVLAPKGFKEILFEELKELGLKKLESSASGVFFEGSWADTYRVNLQSRVATRVLKPLLDFYAYQPEDIYNHIKKHDFTKYISVTQSLHITSHVSDCKIHDQRIVTLKAKDAIVDHFRASFDGERPNVDKDEPDLPLVIYGKKNHFWLYLDTSGEPLFQRGYRKQTGLAPLKENVAAGLLKLAAWDKRTPIIDPFCGSGTILIEAALMALNRAPGSLGRGFAFQKWKNYDAKIFYDVFQQAKAQELKPSDVGVKLIGYDLARESIAAARKNAEAAGVAELVHFQRQGIDRLEPGQLPPGLLVTNPPYGKRLSKPEIVQQTMKDLGAILKSHFPQWQLWLLSGNPEISRGLGLKSHQKYQVFNGDIECRLIGYRIQKGSFDTRVFRKF